MPQQSDSPDPTSAKVVQVTDDERRRLRAARFGISVSEVDKKSQRSQRFGLNGIY